MAYQHPNSLSAEAFWEEILKTYESKGEGPVLMGQCGGWGEQQWVHRFTMTMVKPLHHGEKEKQNTERVRESTAKENELPGYALEARVSSSEI